MVKHGFSASEVMKLTGLSYRQLDYWANTNFVVPSRVIQIGKRTRREYGFTDILAIRAAMRLLDVGVPLQRIRKAINHLQSELPTKKALSSLVWLTDGENLFVLTERGDLLDILNGQYVFTFAIDIGQLSDKLIKDVEVLESKRSKKKEYKYPDLSAVG
jgi:DNA-binding transcriptional MerR regulator